MITCYLFSLHYENKRTVKEGYDYIVNHWQSWFPNLPSYQCYNARLNALVPAFAHLLSGWLASMHLPADQVEIVLGDSCPIITCAGNRRGKVARELTNKGHCATKKMDYYGLKLHLLALKRHQHLPLPCCLEFTPASVHDITALRDTLLDLHNAPAFLDRAYVDEGLAQEMTTHQAELITPVKRKPGEAECHRQFDAAYNHLKGTAVAKVRQPVEAFFSWVQQKTGIQNASKVRSAKGLLLHLFGKLCGAIMCWVNF